MQLCWGNVVNGVTWLRHKLWNFFQVWHQITAVMNFFALNVTAEWDLVLCINDWTWIFFVADLFSVGLINVHFASYVLYLFSLWLVRHVLFLECLMFFFKVLNSEALDSFCMFKNFCTFICLWCNWRVYFITLISVIYKGQFSANLPISFNGYVLLKKLHFQ